MSTCDSLKYSLELIINKHTLIAETVQHIQSIPEVEKKCGILLSSVLEELRIITSELTATASSLEDTVNIRIKQKHKEEHNYVVQFYDIKVSKLEALIEKLTDQKTKLENKLSVVDRDFKTLESDILSMRKTVSSKENALRTLQTQETQEIKILKEEVDQLIQQLELSEEALKQSESVINDLNFAKSSLEKELRTEKANYSYRVCDLNRSLDQTKSDFMRLVKELEHDNMRLQEENRQVHESLIKRQFEIEQIQKKLAERSNMVKMRESEVEALKQELVSIRRKQEGVCRQLSEFQQNKKLTDSELLEFNQKLRTANSQLQWTLQKKVEEVQLLEEESKKLHELLNQKTSQVYERERTLSFLRMRIEQLEKDKQMLIDQIDIKSRESNELFRQVDLLNKSTEQDRREKLEAQDLLKLAYNKIEEFERLFNQSKEQFEKQVQKFRVENTQVKKQFQGEIQELVRVNQETEQELGVVLQNLERVSALLKEKEVYIQEMERTVNTYKDKLAADKQNESLIEAKYREAKGTWIALEQELATMRVYVKQLEKRVADGAELQNKLIMAQQEIQALQDKIKKSEKETRVAVERVEQGALTAREEMFNIKSRMEEKLRRAGETLSQKQIELATQNSKVRNLEEENAALKRNHQVERGRLEARVGELERMLREKHDFQMKIQSAIYH